MMFSMQYLSPMGISLIHTNTGHKEILDLSDGLLPSVLIENVTPFPLITLLPSGVFKKFLKISPSVISLTTVGFVDKLMRAACLKFIRFFDRIL